MFVHETSCLIFFGSTNIFDQQQHKTNPCISISLWTVTENEPLQNSTLTLVFFDWFEFCTQRTTNTHHPCSLSVHILQNLWKLMCVGNVWDRDKNLGRQCGVCVRVQCQIYLTDDELDLGQMKKKNTNWKVSLERFRNKFSKVEFAPQTKKNSFWCV